MNLSMLALLCRSTTRANSLYLRSLSFRLSHTSRASKCLYKTAEKGCSSLFLCVGTLFGIGFVDKRYGIQIVKAACEKQSLLNENTHFLVQNQVAVTGKWRFILQLISPNLLQLIGACLALCTFLYIGLLGSFGEHMANRIRGQLFTKLIHQDIGYFDSQNSGKILDSISSDVQNFKSSFKQCVSQGLRNGTQIVGSVFALLIISPTLTAVLLGCLPCVFIVGSFMGTQLRQLSREVQIQNSHSASIAEETFSHIRTVKSLVLEDLQLKNFQHETNAARLLNEKLAYGIGIFQGLSNLALNGIVLGVLYIGGHLMFLNQLDPGNLMSFLVTTQTLQRSFAQLSLLYGHIIRGITSLNHIEEMLNLPNGNYTSTQSNSYNKSSKLPVLDKAPELNLSHISFMYPNRPDSIVLNDFTMNLPAGQVIALVGHSGAGKSTVVSLLERFYDPNKGEILINDQNLQDLDISFVRGKLIGFISQEPQIFNNTIRENIRFGRLDATDEEVEEAAKLAYAHDFIVHDLPQGYDTQVGQGTGITAGLSGGQRQRIAIARVLLKNAPIILMDEATSALDSESEAKVQDALNFAIKDRTVLIIAHRLSTIRRANLIYVMSKGKIVEQGTHEELMTKRQYYYELVQRQEGQNDLIQ